MSNDFLKDPLSLFSVKGKNAIVTGATGAVVVVVTATVVDVAGTVVLVVVVSVGDEGLMTTPHAGVNKSVAKRAIRFI